MSWTDPCANCGEHRADCHCNSYACTKKQSKVMEDFIYNETFYCDLGALCDDLLEKEEDIRDLPDDWKIIAKKTTSGPLLELSADWIFERINDERFSEEGNEEADVLKALSLIDYAAVNKAMPMMWYETPHKFEIKKQDLLDYIRHFE